MIDDLVTGWDYAPVPNMDHEGARVRKRITATVAAVGLVTLIILFGVGAPGYVRYLTSAAFAWPILLNFFQASDRFCVWNAVRGTYERHFRSRRITDSRARLQNRKHLIKVVLQVTGLSLLAGLIGFLPF
jgi:hypothetical protein